jgi:GNAT superfamily N-acetyltransferase
MPGKRSSEEREYAVPVAELRALEEDIGAAPKAAERALAPGGLALDLQAHPRPSPALRGERVRLADGAEIFIRPVEPEDRHELAVGFERLSAMSRLQRFHERIDHLTARQLIELVDIDHESHEALGALDVVAGEGIGIARYDRDPDDPTRAEFACTVADLWQRRGVGTALIERLAARARANGIERFEAVILVGNEPGHS